MSPRGLTEAVNMISLTNFFVWTLPVGYEWKALQGNSTPRGRIQVLAGSFQPTLRGRHQQQQQIGANSTLCYPAQWR